MAEPSRRIEMLSDFDIPWCQEVISSATHVFPDAQRRPPPPLDAAYPNAIISEQLWNDEGLRAFLHLTRAAPSGAAHPVENALLISLGRGVDAQLGVMHGGVGALLMDQLLAMQAMITMSRAASYTKSLLIEYRKKVRTPAVIMCRAWLVEVGENEAKVKGLIRDGEGVTLLEATGIFVLGKAQGKL